MIEEENRIRKKNNICIGLSWRLYKLLRNAYLLIISKKTKIYKNE